MDTSAKTYHSNEMPARQAVFNAVLGSPRIVSAEGPETEHSDEQRDLLEAVEEINRQRINE